MKQSFLLISISMLFINKIRAQEHIVTMNNKNYTAANNWNFLSENLSANYLTAQIIKAEKGGYLKLATDVADSDFFIGGTAFLYLDNGDFITCIDKNNRDYIDGKSIIYYTLTPQEIEKLKKYDIQNIRYAIKSLKNNPFSKTGYFSANNKNTYIKLRTNDTNENDQIKTAEELRLFWN